MAGRNSHPAPPPADIQAPADIETAQLGWLRDLLRADRPPAAVVRSAKAAFRRPAGEAGEGAAR